VLAVETTKNSISLQAMKDGGLNQDFWLNNSQHQSTTIKYTTIYNKNNKATTHTQQSSG
jgi:hypothetical protein